MSSFSAAAGSCFRGEKKSLKALCTKSTSQMDSVVDKLVNIEGHLAAKEVDISLRTWWRPKAELRNFYLPEVSLQIRSNFTTSAPLPWVVGVKWHHLLGPNADIFFGACVRNPEKSVIGEIMTACEEGLYQRTHSFLSYKHPPECYKPQHAH